VIEQVERADGAAQERKLRDMQVRCVSRLSVVAISSRVLARRGEMRHDQACVTYGKEAVLIYDKLATKPDELSKLVTKSIALSP